MLPIYQLLFCASPRVRPDRDVLDPLLVLLSLMAFSDLR
jgi:hypothetical protein